jgi:integrase
MNESTNETESNATNAKHQRPRGTGSIYQQRGSANWWLQYYRNGKVYRQSAGTTNRRKAERMLQRKIGEIATGNFLEPASEKTIVICTRCAHPTDDKESSDSRKSACGCLAADLLTEYEANARHSLVNVRRNWEKHLATRFENTRARDVRTDALNQYITERQAEGASNASINRELAALKRAFKLGMIAGKVAKIPIFPHLAERNVRQGFLDDAAYSKLAKACASEGLWLRAMFEVGCAFGWRVNELRQLKVAQIDLLARTIRLEPGTTKNSEGRTVVMTELVYQLLAQCISGKKADERVFTRKEGNVQLPIGDFRKVWAKVCCAAGVGKMLCPSCEREVAKDVKGKAKCSDCSKEWKNKELDFSGLLFHDLRRTAVRNMVRRGIPERVAMTISGHKTRAVFDRYNIVNEADLRDAAKRLEVRAEPMLDPAGISQRQADYSYSSDIVSPLPAPIANSGEMN